MVRTNSGSGRRSSFVHRWALAAGFFSSLALCLVPIVNSDLFWHLSAGRFIAEHHEIPSKDFLSWTQQGRPWIDFEWGTQVLYYALDRAGGPAALWLFKVCAFAGLLVLFIALLRMEELPDHWIGAALFPSTLSLLWSIDIRPEIASLILVLAQVYVLERLRLGKVRAPTRWLLLAHLFGYAVWANLHPGFLIGTMLCLIYYAGEALEKRRDSRWLALAAAGVLGSFLNPYGPKLYGVLLEHWRQLPLLRKYIIEWSPLNPFNLYQSTYWVLLPFSLSAFAMGLWTGRRAPYAHLIAAVVFAFLSSRSYRQISYFSVTVLPLALTAMYRTRLPDGWMRARPYVLGTLFAGLAVVTFQIARHENFRGGIDETRRLQPVAACEFLRHNEPALAPLKMYNFWNFGGYIGYTLYPDYKVFMDSRYLFTHYLPSIYQQAMASPAAWQQFLDDQGVELVFMDATTVLVKDPAAPISLWRPKDVYYMPQKEWALVYWDTKAVIWIRRSSTPKQWLEEHEFRYLHPGDFQFLSLRVLGRAISAKAVFQEIDRYNLQIGDPAESERLLHWSREMLR